MTRWQAAYNDWQTGAVRFTPHLADAEIEQRYEAVGTILLELIDHAEDSGVSLGSLVTVAMRAISNARIAIAYYLRGKDLPPSSFPSPQETIAPLGQGEPHQLAADAPLRRWLHAHPVPPWRWARIRPLK